MEISECVVIDVSVPFLELVSLLLMKITFSFPVLCSVTVFRLLFVSVIICFPSVTLYSKSKNI